MTWKIDFPAEAVRGNIEFESMRFNGGLAVFPTNAADNKKSIYALTTNGQLAQIWDT